MSNKKETKYVHLDLRGHIYKVPRSLLEEQKPDTVLARLVDDKWYPQDNEEKIFINRDGECFRYVLDLLCDGKVFLPLSESREAFQVDLDYFGLEDTKEDPFDIQYGSLAEASNLLQVTEENEEDELQEQDDMIEKCKAAIEECQSKKSAIKTANKLFRRSSKGEWTTTNDEPGWEQTTVKFEDGPYGSVADQTYKDAKASLGVEDFLGRRLEVDRLVVVKTSVKHSKCKFLLKRSIQKKANNEDEAAIDKEKKEKSPPSRQQRKRKARAT